jgi:hypothetical protein
VTINRAGEAGAQKLGGNLVIVCGDAFADSNVCDARWNVACHSDHSAVVFRAEHLSLIYAQAVGHLSGDRRETFIRAQPSSYERREPPQRRELGIV